MLQPVPVSRRTSMEPPINTWLMRDLRTPFGGVGQSGLGREGGFEAMSFFTEPKNVCVAVNNERMD